MEANSEAGVRQLFLDRAKQLLDDEGILTEEMAAEAEARGLVQELEEYAKTVCYDCNGNGCSACSE